MRNVIGLACALAVLALAAPALSGCNDKRNAAHDGGTTPVGNSNTTNECPRADGEPCR